MLVGFLTNRTGAFRLPQLLSRDVQKTYCNHVATIATVLLELIRVRRAHQSQGARESTQITRDQFFDDNALLLGELDAICCGGGAVGGAADVIHDATRAPWVTADMFDQMWRAMMVAPAIPNLFSVRELLIRAVAFASVSNS